MIYGDVTMEVWWNMEMVQEGTSPIWFGMLDENMKAKFLYGIFVRKRAVNVTHTMTDMMGTVTNVTKIDYVADLEIGHTSARGALSKSGHYNLTWPLEKGPLNLTKTYYTGLMVRCWHHIAAVRNLKARTWTLYINGSYYGHFSYGNVTDVPSLKMTQIKYGKVRYKARLYAFFEEYDPTEYWKVEDWLAQYKGREEELFTYLYNLYPAAARSLANANHTNGTMPQAPYPDNFLPQDKTFENGIHGDNRNPNSRPIDLNAAGTEPRTRDSPFPCDPRIHGVDVCMLPWGSIGHHTVPQITVGRGALKHETHKGMIEELRIWKSVRTEAELQVNMDIELGGTEPGLLAYFNFNEGKGNMAYDTGTKGTRPENNNHNLHLLGYPADMWRYDPLVPSFTDSAKYCPHCSILYTIQPETVAPPDQRFEQKYTEFKIEPSYGPILGGTLITIHGRGFMDSDRLWSRWQGIAPLQGGQGQGAGFIKPEFIDSNRVRLVTPAHSLLGPVDIFFTNDGEYFNLQPIQFNYTKTKAIIHRMSVAPVEGAGHRATYCEIRTPMSGGTTITVHGENFMQTEVSKLCYFRLGELPMMPCEKYVDENHVLIKTPPLHSQFYGDEDFVDVDGQNTHPHDAAVAPRTYYREAPYPMQEMRANSKSKNTNSMDPRYPIWGQGKPFDCSRDKPGTTCYRPVFTIRLTMDGGRNWAYLPQYTTTIEDNTGTLRNRTHCIFYSDLIVGPHGDDDMGDGTLTRPFKSLMKAAEWAHAENDRILVFTGAYKTSELQQVMMLPKRLTIYQEEPLRTDQSFYGKPMHRMCKCKDQGEDLRGKTLCSCEHGNGLSFFQQGQLDSQLRDYDEMAHSARDISMGTADLGAYMIANGGHGDSSFIGQSRTDFPDSLAHGDFLGAVDPDADVEEGMTTGFEGFSGDRRL